MFGTIQKNFNAREYIQERKKIMRTWMISKKDDLDVAIRWLAVIVLGTMAAESIIYQFQRLAKVIVLVVQGAART